MKHFIYTLITFILAGLCTGYVSSAELEVYSKNKQYAKNEIFTVEIRLSSEDEPVNAISYVVTYPNDDLELMNITRNDGIVSFWIDKGEFVDNPGIITMEGLMIDSAYQGSGEVLASLMFKATKNAPALVSITEAAVHAYNGLGTNVYTGGDVDLQLSFEGAVTDRGNDLIQSEIFKQEKEYSFWDMIFTILVTIGITLVIIILLMKRKYHLITKDEKDKFYNVLNR